MNNSWLADFHLSEMLSSIDRELIQGIFIKVMLDDSPSECLWWISIAFNHCVLAIELCWCLYAKSSFRDWLALDILSNLSEEPIVPRNHKVILFVGLVILHLMTKDSFYVGIHSIQF